MYFIFLYRIPCLNLLSLSLFLLLKKVINSNFVIHHCPPFGDKIKRKKYTYTCIFVVWIFLYLKNFWVCDPRWRVKSKFHQIPIHWYLLDHWFLGPHGLLHSCMNSLRQPYPNHRWICPVQSPDPLFSPYDLHALFSAYSHVLYYSRVWLLSLWCLIALKSSEK